MYYAYILECADHTLYTGSTNDLAKRVRQHNESTLGAHYTKIRRPVELVYFEKCGTISEARRRECEIKKLPREKKMQLIRITAKR